MKNLYQLVECFRFAIEEAVANREFYGDCRFQSFPRGCCDDTCDLLAEFLAEHNIKTLQVVGDYYDGNPENNTSHAWLCLDEEIIIDITGDQFKWDNTFLRFDKPIYIGPKTDFYRLFEIRNVAESCNIHNNPRLADIFERLQKYLK